MGRGRGRGGDDDWLPYAGGCCCVITIASVIMFACSFSILTPHQIGLHYNSVTLNLETTTDTSGRYFLGLGHWFIKFPRNLQYVEFSASTDGGSRNTPINVWSKDGQEIVIEVGFYYQIQPEKLSEIYYKYKDDGYVEVIEDIATNTFRDVATKHDTIAFFNDRVTINKEMHEELTSRLSEIMMVDVPRFNLLSIDTPTMFEQAIVDKVIKEQRKITLQFQQQSAIIEEEINVIQADATRQTTVLKAESQANGTLIVRRAEAEAFKLIQTEMSTLRKQLALDLGFNGTSSTDFTDLMNFMWLDVVKGQTANSKLVFNADTMLLDA